MCYGREEEIFMHIIFCVAVEITDMQLGHKIHLFCKMPLQTTTSPTNWSWLQISEHILCYKLYSGM